MTFLCNIVERLRSYHDAHTGFIMKNRVATQSLNEQNYLQNLSFLLLYPETNTCGSCMKKILPRARQYILITTKNLHPSLFGLRVCFCQRRHDLSQLLFEISFSRKFLLECSI